MAKNVQLEELALLSQGTSALKKLIFLYEKDSSIEPVCISLEELFRRILTDPKNPDLDSESEYLGLKSLKTTVSRISDKLETIKDEITKELGGSNALNEINANIAQIIRTLNGDAGSGAKGVLKNLELLEKNLTNVQSLVQGVQTLVSSHTTQIQSVTSVANTAKSKAETLERQVADLTGDSGIKLMAWKSI